MNKEQKSILLKLQQGELDGVVLYKKLSELEELKEIKNELLQMAADEGRHAAILRTYTGEVLQPSDELANRIIHMFKAVGREKVLEALAEGEFKGGPTYEKLGETFEKLKNIAEDEINHGNMLLRLK